MFPGDLLWGDVDSLARDRLSSTYDGCRHDGCGDVPVHKVNAANICDVRNVGNIGHISHVGDIDLTQIPGTVMVPWHEGLSRSRGNQAATPALPKLKPKEKPDPPTNATKAGEYTGTTATGPGTHPHAPPINAQRP